MAEMGKETGKEASKEMGKEMGKGVTAGKLASTMQKRLTRAQEKVMQKLGKADETKDTAFEETVSNFNKQMAEGARLQRDLRGYMTAVKSMHEASKRLQDCLAEMYEPDWFGKEEVDSMAEDTDMLWIDFHQKLVDSALINMDNYMAQFPDIKNRISKRDRKLVDFDSARHHMASIQKGKKKDEVKIAKPVTILEKAAPGWAQGMIAAHQVAQTNLSRNQAEEELGRAQKVFEEINTELQDELPTLWDSRVGLYVTTFQSLAGVTEKFHNEMGKLSHNLNDVMGKLEDQRHIKNDSKTKTPAKSEEAANHSAESGSIPKSPSKSRPPGPPVPRPPRPSPSREGLQDDGINLFGDDITVPMTTASHDVSASTQYKGSALASLLDLDLDAMQAMATPTSFQAPSWDSWEPEQPPTTEPQQWVDEDEDTQQASYDQSYQQQPSWDDDAAQGYSQEQQTWDDPQEGQGYDQQQTWDQPAEGQAYDQQTWDDSTGEGQPGWEDDTSTAQQGSWGDEGAEDEAQEGRDEGGADGTGGQSEWGDAAGQAGWAESELPQREGEEPSSNAVANGSSDTGDLPPGVLYKVKALHDYAATDGDELEMKSGDIVLVVAFDNPDEQDEGWLLGVKESHWLANKNLSARGVFPENFTQRC